jgi:hypothetical protein
MKKITMKANSQYSTLSLSQRAHIIAEQGGEFYTSLMYIVLFLGFLVAISLSTVPPDPRSIFEIILFAVVVVIIAYMIVYTIFKSRYLNRLLESWNKDYLQQSYILVFDTTVPEGNTNAEKVFNLATAVFPELIGPIPSISLPTPLNRLMLYLKSKMRNLKRRTTIWKTWNYKVDSYLLDLVHETDSGLFIIKDFKDNVVKLNDLKQLVEVIDGSIKTNIFRTICVAKHYDQIFFDSESLETLMKKNLKSDFPIDLLIEEDVGYTAIWIS